MFSFTLVELLCHRVEVVLSSLCLLGLFMLIHSMSFAQPGIQECLSLLLCLVSRLGNQFLGFELDVLYLSEMFGVSNVFKTFDVRALSCFSFCHGVLLPRSKGAEFNGFKLRLCLMVRSLQTMFNRRNVLHGFAILGTFRFKQSY